MRREMQGVRLDLDADVSAQCDGRKRRVRFDRLSGRSGVEDSDETFAEGGLEAGCGSSRRQAGPDCRYPGFTRPVLQLRPWLIEARGMC
jgi:hypothetical protein